jgi:hypothetical protein
MRLSRLHPVVFVALCLAGVVASVALTVHEVARTAPIALHVSGTHRSGNTTVVTVSVRNTTSASRCIAVRVAARDRSGHDLAAVTATPELTVPAHARRNVSAGLTLTARQYAERLDAFYPSARACASG